MEDVPPSPASLEHEIRPMAITKAGIIRFNILTENISQYTLNEC
jgi:hypothetical protein